MRKETFIFLTQLVQFTPEINMEQLGIRDWETTGIRYEDKRLSVVIPCTHLSRISNREFEELNHRVEFLSHIRPADRDFGYLKPMPKEQEKFEMDLFLTESELARLRYGFYPDNDTKWFIYLNDSKIHVHRSSFGHCIFQLNLKYDGERYRIASGVVNRNPEQYNSTDIERDKNFVLDLLHDLFHIWIC